MTLAAAAVIMGAGAWGLRSFAGGGTSNGWISRLFEASASPASVASPSPSAADRTPAFADQIDESSFLRGNLHTHSLRSDGDSPPSEVYAYYREHGYSFLVLTDHNTRTDPAEHRAEQRPGFALIPGEEVTTTGAGKPVHVNAICTRRTIGGGTFATAREALTWAVARVKEQQGVALVNHPNFDWALTADDLPAARGAELLEIFSGHPYVHTEGDTLRPSHEALWTRMLDAGESFAGVAVDDAHYLDPSAKEPAARPLRGWVQVFGAQATEQAICDGLRRGRLYSSSGPELSRLIVSDRVLALTVASPARVEFLGAEGAMLAASDVQAGGEARYELRGGERYVRARVTDDKGRRAWTQAYRVLR